MDIPTLGAAIIVLIGLYGLHRLALQRAYAQGLADGTHRGYAAGSGDAARRYGQGHEDGLIEGRAQAGRELTTPKYNAGYERGQLDLLATFEQAEQARGAGPTMSA